MNYALIENGIVTNIIYLHPNNAHDFKNAVLTDPFCVAIGDVYENGVFYRNGKLVQTNVEFINRIHEAEATIAELDAALLEVTYQNIMGEIE